jgi:predicted nucleic acid-binding protein
MSASRFLDTNVLLYAYDLDAPDKRAVALQLVEQGWTFLGDTAISVQVLEEMHVNLGKRGVPLVEATQIVRDFAAWPVVDNTLTLLQAGLNEQSRWQVSLWDALILAAARVSGATKLYSEDYNHGQNYGGIQVINPFR